MSDPEIALVLTPEAWVEELHRHLTDHGGARIRQVVVEPGVALEESYDVLVVSHRWPALTRAFVAELRASGRAVLGVYDREEPAGRDHLHDLEIDRAVVSDAGPPAIVEEIRRVRARPEPATAMPAPARARRGRVVVVGGPYGTGRTEVAVQLARELGRDRPTVLVDADDVAPGVAPRLGLPIEPNLRAAVDAVEHGRGELGTAVATAAGGLRVVAGLPSARAWSQLRPGEVMRVVGRLAADGGVVVDGAGALEEVGGTGYGTTRGRNAVARALVAEADVVVAVCDASPVGATRLLSWAVDARTLAPGAPMVVVANRAPMARFRRAELYEEITRTLPCDDVVFVPADRRVTEAAWSGGIVGRGAFTKGVAAVAVAVRSCVDRRPVHVGDGGVAGGVAGAVAADVAVAEAS